MPGACTAISATASTVSNPISISNPEAETPFTATPARFSPIAATIAPVRTGGISRSTQAVPETCTTRPITA
jgi:hypothetical protein